MRNTRIVLLATVMALLMAGCGDDDSALTTLADEGGAPGTTAAPGTTIPASGPVGPGDGDAAGEEPNAGPIEDALTPTDSGRSIIFTANIEVEVADVAAAAQRAQTAISGLGGFLFGQETVTEPASKSVLVFKVLPENFTEALGRLGGLGKLKSQSVFADDVTERVVDLESRIATGEASVARLRALLESATDIEAIVALEAELLQRETDLEVLRGQLRTLEGQVALATITMVLTEPVPDDPEPRIEVVQTAYIGHDSGAGCPGSEELEADEGDRVTLCLAIENAGDTSLEEIEARDQGLDADPDDFLVVEGDPGAPLTPEGVLILALEVNAQPDRRTAPAIEATAVDDDGEPLRVAVEVDIETAALQVAPDDSLPGFGDALGASWNALKQLFGLGVVIAGALVPFLWLVLIAGYLLWWRRRRVSGEDAGKQG